MAQNYTNDVSETWEQLTDANVTSITFNCKGPSAIYVAVAVGAVAPTNLDDAILYMPGSGEIARLLSELAPGISGTRVYARAVDAGSLVYVSHA